MDTVHIHLLLNHVPMIGTVFAIALLALAAVKRSNELAQASLGAFVLLALVAVVVFLTGEAAEEAVEGLPGVSEAIIERHEEAALVAMISLGTLGALALGALVLLRRGIPRAVMLVALLLALVPAGAMARAANLGGQIRHTEIRSGTSISMTGQEAGQRTPSGEAWHERRERDHD